MGGISKQKQQVLDPHRQKDSSIPNSRIARSCSCPSPTDYRQVPPPPCIQNRFAESALRRRRLDQIHFDPLATALCPEYPKMVTLVSRQGRHLQRYTNLGRRKVVGCIPYKLTNQNQTAEGTAGGGINGSLRVLVVSSQKGRDILFPKGGWEMDESITEAVSREAFEEAGVTGTIEDRLGMWCYRSKSRDAIHEGIMFSLHVEEELGEWPEMCARQRVWVTVQEFKQRCLHAWMVEALDRLVLQLSNKDQALSHPGF